MKKNGSEKFVPNESQKSLYNVLAAYSVYNDTIGYCQGMQAISALLLMFMDEESVFFVLNLIAMHPKYGSLALCWNMSEITMRFKQFELCFKEYLPKLYRHLNKNGIVNVSMFGTTAWFITIFISANAIDFDLIVRIWDIYLFKGIKAVFMFGIAYLKYLEKQLLNESNFEGLMEILSDGFEQISKQNDSENYIQMAISTKIKRKQMDKWAKEYFSKK